MQDHDITVRSLRRRLRQAMQEENVEEVMKIYTASKEDLVEWIDREEAEAEAQRLAEEEEKARQKREKREARPVALKKFGSMVRSTRQSFKSADPFGKNEGMDGCKQRSWKVKKDQLVVTSSARSDQQVQMHAQKTMVLPTSHSGSLSESSSIGVLQLELNPSEPFTADDEKSPYDPFVEEVAAPVAEKPPVSRKKPRKLRQRQPRLAGFFGRFGVSPKDDLKLSLGENSFDEEDDPIDTNMTTPLHEAARLGSASLVRLMLSHGADPNVKNGQMRTALHMAAGGLAHVEEELLLAKYHVEKKDLHVESTNMSFSSRAKEPLGPGVGIGRHEENPEDSDDSGSSSDGDHPGTVKAKKAARAMGRFFKNLGKKNNMDEAAPIEEAPEQKPIPVLDMDRLNRLCSDRMDTVLCLLSWCHPDDGGPRAGEGLSINSVDARGRTALHYASELGRSDVCLAVLNSFGAILTIVDESGQTPCELAGDRTHRLLASQLEARALLYADPYGLDDELLNSVLAESRFAPVVAPRNGDNDPNVSEAVRHFRKHRQAFRKHVVTPFSWFETWSMKDVRRTRRDLVEMALDQMRTVLADRNLDKQMNELMFSHAGLEESNVCQGVKDGTSDDEGSEIAERKLSAAADSTRGGDSDDHNEVEDHPGEAPERKTPPDTQNDAALGDTQRENEVGEDEIVCDTGIVRKESDNDMGLDDTVSEIENETEKEQPEVDPGVVEQSLQTPQERSVCSRNESEAEVEDTGLEKASDRIVWSAELPQGVKTNDRFTIGVNGRDIHVRCPANLEPGRLFRFTIEEEASSDTEGETKIRVIESRLPQQNGDGSKGCNDQSETMQRRIHECHAERLLSFHKWQYHESVNAFREDPEKALRDAGVVVDLEWDGSDNLKSLPHEPKERMCLICFDHVDSTSPEWTSLRGCDHGFCTECLSGYIADAAQSKSFGVCICCPHHACCAFLCQSELKELASSQVYGSLVKAADENYVTSSDTLRFCPHPGCHGVVRNLVPQYRLSENRDISLVGLSGAVCRAVPVNGHGGQNAPFTYQGIQDERYESIEVCQPAKAHRFCFVCGGEMHWPVTCDVLEQWNARVEKEVGPPEDDEDTGKEKFDDVAQRLWMKANTRPCPRCKAPIEKNEGCNHMTCSNRSCRHEFCWICRKDWKLHNTETGGFFRCNRWQVEDDHDPYDELPPPQPEGEDTPADGPNEQNEENPNGQGYGTAIHSARAAWKKSKIMARFLHHYRRWTAHRESAALEMRMADTVGTRLAPVVEAAIDFSGLPDFNFGGKGLSFVHAAFAELLECRSMLQHSYALAFFRYPTFYYMHQQAEMQKKEREKMMFELIQSQLEMLTEQLSDIVARSHLRATQTQIMFLTKGAAEKREEFSSLIIVLLNRTEDEEASDEEHRDESSSPSAALLVPRRAELSRVSDYLYGLAPHQAARHIDGTEDELPTAEPVPGDDDDEARIDRLDEAAFQRAVQISMQTYMDRSAPTDDLVESGTLGMNASSDWPCSACTYVNSGGNFCAMCGNMRS